MNNIWLALITGLTTGGLSCFAVQGGLLASSLSQKEEQNLVESKKWQKIAMFLIAKITAYTLLGGLLGILGSAISITPTIQGWLLIFAGLFMLATAGRILDIHPIFRHFTISPPKWAYKLAKKESKSSDLFAPGVLGLLTILLPCGTTQAMMVLAIASGNAFWGAMIMFAFVIGTSPVFFALGMAAAEILKRKALKYVASLAIIILGLMSVNSGQILRGSVHTFQNYYQAAFGGTETQAADNKNIAPIKNGFQQVTVNVTNNGYIPNIQNIKAGVPVKLKLVTNNVRGCSRAFTIPAYNISAVLPLTGTQEITFTPTKTGQLLMACSMGMYTGQLNVI
ncbi:MAG: sulfite exporter TauE/SafE family protein [Patescibacteria group bacterium]